MKFSPTTPTGQYDSSLPSRRSSLFVSKIRTHVADCGIRNLGIAFKIPAESYIAGAYRWIVSAYKIKAGLRLTPSSVMPTHLSV